MQHSKRLEETDRSEVGKSAEDEEMDKEVKDISSHKIENWKPFAYTLNQLWSVCRHNIRSECPSVFLSVSVYVSLFSMQYDIV